MAHNTCLFRRAPVLYADCCRGARLSQAIWLLLLLLLLPLRPLFNQVGADDFQANPSALSPSSTVSVGSYLPTPGTTNNVGLASSNGMFTLQIQAWRDSPNFYCMAGVTNTKVDPNPMLWAANKALPLKVSSSCRLFLSPQGDLLLQYDGNNTAWQTHTAGMGVSNLTLYDSGNLVLHTKQHHIVWQSFTQSPALAWNSGMNLTSNITIYSSTSIPNGVTKFSVPGTFSLQLHNHSTLVLCTNSDDSSRFVYWSSSFTNPSPSQHANREQEVSYVALADNGFIFFDNSSHALGSIALTIPPPPDSSSALRVALIDPPSANLLAFYYNQKWYNYYNSSIGVCEKPTQCGDFSLCNVSTGACTCPPGFRQNARNSCEPGVSFPPPSCSSSAFGTVAAISYSFISVNVSFPPQLSAISSHSVQNCTTLCSENCMCKVALFDPGTSSCSLFSKLQTLPSRTDSKQLMLLKIVAERNSRRTHLGPILGAISAAIVLSLCLICTIGAICCIKRNLKRTPDEEVFLQELPRLPPRYTYKELETATKEFSRQLGAGAFAGVYEGVLPSGMKVAVKKLEAVSGQSSVQFRAEVASIGSVSHMNLLTLRGFCYDGDWRLLVYEHMGRGSLDRWLFKGGEEGKQLGWQRRCKIALDTARGLAYLHHESGERIVHCDVKPQNILLDDEFNAKVGDFGLAKLVGPNRQGFTLTSVKGTRGYLAPEWLQDATVTTKLDVYSFGIVLLELISGRHCLDSDYGYLPTLAFHIVSMSSSSSEGSHWEEMVTTVAPLEPIQYSSSSDRSLGGSKETIFSHSSTSHDSVTARKETISATPQQAFSFSARPRYAGTNYNTAPQPISSSQASCQTDSGFDRLRMKTFLDPRLTEDSHVSARSLERMLFIALWCVQRNPTARPPMNEVTQMMEGILHVPPPPVQVPTSELSLAATSSSFTDQYPALPASSGPLLR